MAAQRLDTPAPVLRLVRDGEGIAAPEPTPSHYQLAFGFLALVPAGEPVERRRRAPRARCAVQPPRRPRQLDLIERHRHLQIYGSRPRSIGRRKLTKVERAQFLVDFRFLQRAGVYAHRPRTWGDCQDHIKGPCGWVSCSLHLAYDVDHKTGVIKQNFPGREVWELEETCSLRVAAEGEHTLERTGELANLTLERARQIVDAALARLRERDEVRALHDDE